MVIYFLWYAISTLAVLIALSASLINEAYLIVFDFTVANSPFNFVISLFNAVFLPKRFFFALSIPEKASAICLFL